MLRGIKFRAFAMLSTGYILLAGSLPVLAQYQKGQPVEYKETYSPPDVMYSTVPGSHGQIIVRSKPSEFYPNGDTRACNVDEVRPSGGATRADAAGAAKQQFKPGIKVSYPAIAGTAEYVTPGGKHWT